jgi:hypothetical protein
MMKKKKSKSKSGAKRETTRSTYELMEAAGLIGCIKGAPKDLSTNKKYFAGLGESKPRRSRGS